MRVLLLIVTLSLSAAGYLFWKKADRLDANGFVTLPAADGHDDQHVYIVAPQNCPGDAAQRAEQMAGQLGISGIPAVRTHSVDFSQLRAQARANQLSESMIKQAQRMNDIMQGPLPIVFVRGRAKNNPAPEEVISEYKRTR
jgi:hypothetical protein